MVPEKSLQKQPVKSQPLKPPLTQSSDSIDQLKHLVGQSFNIFNTHGRPPEAVADIFFGFVSVLGDRDIGEVTDAFVLWMKSSSVMPTPYDILRMMRVKPVEYEWAEAPGESGVHIYFRDGKRYKRVPKK